jgi:signal transduction histidine kinase/HAMP domain-containing protein
MTRARRSGVRLRYSIGTRLFAGFLAMSIITAIVGLYGLESLTEVGAIVADTYDRPLMAINYARSASFTFARMDKETLHRRFAVPADQSAIDQRLSELTRSFFEDLAVAEQRSLSAQERQKITAIRALVQQWSDQVISGSHATEAAEDTLSDQIAQQFDLLIEQTADDSFLQRRQSVLTLERFQRINIMAIGLAFALSAAITYALTRQIFRPLSQAASVAELIGRGELQTPVPPGGKDETGVLLNSLRVMRDRVRAMMESEQAQRRSAQARLIDAIESSEEGMVLVDAENRIVLANERFTSLFQNIAGVLDMEAAEQEGGARVLMWPAGSEGARLLEEGGEVLLPDGRWIRVARSPTREGGFFLFLGDITELKEREESFKAAKLAAEAASIAKSQFLANMSHELRTPLNAIIGFSDMFIGEYYGPLGSPTYMQHAREINASGWRLLEVIQNVLDLSQSQSGRLTFNAEPFDLRETIEECRRPLAKACAEAGLKLTVTMPDEPLMVRGDADKLRRVLDNLTSNAIKFTRRGGDITMAITGDRSHVRFQVTDTGIGMAEHEVPLAFAAFSQIDARLDRRYEGSGLGLPLAKAFIDLHGGEILLDSEPGRGTTVTVILKRLIERARADVAAG